MTGIDFLKEYRQNKDKYLPMIDHERKQFETRTEFGDINLGWNCGAIGDRPYFTELWAAEGATMLTIFISTIGIEDCTVDDIERLLIDEAEIYTKKTGYESPTDIPRIVDGDGNEFYSVNILVGLDEEPAVIEGGMIYPFSMLNAMNA